MGRVQAAFLISLATACLGTYSLPSELSSEEIPAAVPHQGHHLPWDTVAGTEFFLDSVPT